MELFHSLENKVRQLPRDEGGSVLLLSGMMAFLIAIMALFAVDTSQAVYNRITAQNAADAAAETAALWQARGLNLEQELNDFHYFFNESIFFAEVVNLAQCVSSIPDDQACPAACTVGDIFTGLGACEAACGALQSDCNACNSALTDNNNCKKVAGDILGMQSGIADAFPLMELAFASQAAQQSGADPVTSVVPEYVGGAMSTLLPSGLSSLGSAVSGVGGGLSSLTSKLPSGFQFYAMPINNINPITSVSLNVEQKAGGYWPWIWDFVSANDGEQSAYQVAIAAMWILATASCASDGDFTCFEVGDMPIILNTSGLNPDSWGWNDSYYIGHPGYMTWVAGKTNQTELAGLGKISWLNANQSSPAQVSYWMNQTNLAMYTGPATISGTGLQIPAFIGLASSQVEGTGVIAVDEGLIHEITTDFTQLRNFKSALETAVGFVPLDSTPRLISVYLPPGTSGTTYWIYH